MAKDIVKEIRRAMRRKCSAEEKNRIVLEGAGRSGRLGAVSSGRDHPDDVLPLAQGISWIRARGHSAGRDDGGGQAPQEENETLKRDDISI